MIKKDLLELVKNEIEHKIQDSIHHNNNLKHDLFSEQKNSTGDKYETNRAQVQIEMEKIGKQINNLENIKRELLKIDISKVHHKINIGSLIKTSHNWIWISVPYGKVIDNQNNVIWLISAKAPLAQILMNKTVGQKAVFLDKDYEIIEVL